MLQRLSKSHYDRIVTGGTINEKAVFELLGPRILSMNGAVLVLINSSKIERTQMINVRGFSLNEDAPAISMSEFTGDNTGFLADPMNVNILTEFIWIVDRNINEDDLMASFLFTLMITIDLMTQRGSDDANINMVPYEYLLRQCRWLPQTPVGTVITNNLENNTGLLLSWAKAWITTKVKSISSNIFEEVKKLRPLSILAAPRK
jgi:hypothetical protein